MIVRGGYRMRGVVLEVEGSLKWKWLGWMGRMLKE